MLEDILAGKKSLFADGVSTVLRGQENRNRRVILLKGNLVGNVRSESRGVSSRVCKNGVYGFSSMAEYSEDAAEAVLKAATENALFLGNHTNKNVNLRKVESGLFVPYRDIVDLEQKRFIDLCKDLDAYIEKTYPDLLSRTVIYTEDSQDKIIYTSDACSGHVVTPRCFIYIFMSTESDSGAPIELFKAFGGRGCADDWFKDVTWMYPQIEELHKHLMDKKSGVYAEAGYKDVILGGSLAGMLAHEAVGHTVEADLVLGGSIAGKVLNERVASDLVTLIDYANVNNEGKEAALPIFMDDEGTKATDAVLIKDGILTGYMHDRESAERHGVEATGNARGWSFSDEPLIRMRNTAVLPGHDTLEDMIASIDDGYYLCETQNGQADLTGEFMFGICMGYEIKKGKLGKAILDTTVSGIAFDMLKTVDMVSDKMTWSSSGFCGKKQMIPVSMGGPELKCKIMIGGR